MEDPVKEDPHQPLKSHYWDIKWRELRPLILAAPFVTFVLGLIVAFFIFHQQPPSGAQDVSLPTSTPPTSTTAERLYDHTYESSCTVTKHTVVHIPINTAVLLPPDCLLIAIGSVDGYIAVVGEEGNKILAIVPPKHVAEFTRARGFFDWNNDDAHASIKMLPRHKE
jgi:hypothetical protein